MSQLNHNATCFQAVEAGDLNLLRLLLGKGFSANLFNAEGESLARFAIKHDRVECLSVLIEAGLDVNEITSRSGRRLVMDAASRQNDGCLRLLIDSRANLHAKSGAGTDAVSEASHFGSVSCLKALIDAGCGVNGKDTNGKTPAMDAAERGHVECLEVLINAGCLPDAEDCEGRTPVIYAAANGHIKCIEVLEKSGADLEWKDESGYTAMAFAAENNHVCCMKGLLLFGCDIFGQIGGFSLAVLCVRKGSFEALDWLLAMEIDPNEISQRNGMTLLGETAAYRDAAVLGRLMKKGIEMDAVDKHGRTAAMVAIEEGRADCLEVLLDHGCEIPKEYLARLEEMPEQIPSRSSCIELLRCRAERGQLNLVVGLSGIEQHQRRL